MTGNGDFDGVSQWGEFVLKLQYTPPSGNTAATLKVVDHWTPWTDLARTGQKAAATRAIRRQRRLRSSGNRSAARMNFALKNARLVPNINDRASRQFSSFPKWPRRMVGPGLGIGGSGLHLLHRRLHCCWQGRHRLSGQDGARWAERRCRSRKSQNELREACSTAGLADHEPGTGGPVPGRSPDPELLPMGRYGASPYYPRAVLRPRAELVDDLRVGREFSAHKWKVSSTGALTYVAQSHEFASDNVRETPPGGMPGGCSGSSNGATPTRRFFSARSPTAMRMLTSLMAASSFTTRCTSRRTDR